MKNDDDFLRIARVIDAHGLNGRLKIAIITDNLERFNNGDTIYLKIDGSYRSYTINGFQILKQRSALLELSNITDRNQAESLKGFEIFITKEKAEQTRAELDDNSFYFYDLIGCKVCLNGQLFAEVTDIMQAGSGDILVITNMEQKKLMIPFVESMVDTTRLKEGFIDINPVEGLFDI